MMKTIKIFGLSLIAALLAGMISPVAVCARSLDFKDLQKVECAREKMRILAMMFDVESFSADKTYTLPESCGGTEKSRKIKAPEWFAEELARMDRNKIIYVKEEDKSETLSEADIWRAAFSNVFLYLNRVIDAMESNKPVQIDQLARDFVGNRLNLMATLDRLNKDLVRGKTIVVLKDSMNGRARGMLGTLEVINSEFFSTIEAFSSPVVQRDEKYRQAVLAVTTLSNQLFFEFESYPVPVFGSAPKSLGKVNKVNRLMILLLLLMGSVFAGGFVFTLFMEKQQDIDAMASNFRAKSLIWAEDFNRQFVTFDVKYIVFGIIGLFMLFGLFCGVTVGGFGGVFVFLLVLVFGAVVSVRVPESLLETIKRARGVKVNKQLQDALILLSNSLRSGMDIVQGFEMVSRDLLPPISDEFGLVVKNYQLGTPFEQALDGLNDRIDSRMLSYIIKAIIIQRQVGGNLTVIFSRLVENIREESKLEEKLQAMTAQQKIQSIVVSIMPFVMMLVMFIFNPSQMISFYTSPVGIIIFLFCVFWIAIGMKVLKKLGEVQV